LGSQSWGKEKDEAQICETQTARDRKVQAQGGTGADYSQHAAVAVYLVVALLGEVKLLGNLFT